MTNLAPLDLIIYRAALALRFRDVVTGAVVAAGLHVRAWAFDPLAPQPARRVDEAEQSPNSGLYGFRSLVGLERYQIGDNSPAGSRAFLVHVEDRLGRYLPQTLRYDLPLANPAVQPVSLFPAADGATPPGYATVRVQLLVTSAPAGAPPQVTAGAGAAWAQASITVPSGRPGHPPITVWGQADSRGTAVIMAPYPLLATDVLLDQARWTITLAVNHEPAAQAADYALIARVLPGMLPGTAAFTQFPPFQATLAAQAAATLFGSVTLVNAQTRTYAISGPVDQTSLDFDLFFGPPLAVRTAVSGHPERPLAELLILSA